MREMLNGSLAAAQGVAQWLEQSQQLNAQMVETLNENLNSALREAEEEVMLPAGGVVQEAERRAAVV